MITITLPLLKLWFWVMLLGMGLIAFALIHFTIEAIKKRQLLVTRQVDAWNKIRSIFS